MKLSPALPGTVSARTPDRSPPCFPDSEDCLFQPDMDVLPMCSIFQELQIVHETGYFSALPSLEEYWQQWLESLRWWGEGIADLCSV
uniref:Kruppel-like transcription factor 6 n=1 Tax=Mus musculus TaxID=10090 RepID=A0A1Y7VLA9_MOUSE